MARIGRIELVRTLNTLITQEREHGRHLVAEGQIDGYVLGLSDGKMDAYKTVLGLLGSSDMDMSESVIGITETTEASLARLFVGEDIPVLARESEE